MLLPRQRDAFLKNNRKMSVADKNIEKEPDHLVSDDDLRCGDSLDNERAFTKEEEGLEATGKVVQTRAGATSGAIPGPSDTLNPPAVVDYLRNFLFKAGMSETLHCFQTEWYEMIQKGLVDEDRADLVPDVYFQNQRLESELEVARMETELSRRTAAATAEALERLQRAVDVERRLQNRLKQENKRLSEESRKLRLKCEKQQPTVQQRMDEKSRVAAEKDKSVLQPQIDQQRSSSVESTLNKTNPRNAVSKTAHI